MDYKKSPLSYMGNKYRLLKDIIPMLPKNINNFYDVFGGSGVVSLNVKANNIFYNDSNEFVCKIIDVCFKHTSQTRTRLNEIHSKEQLKSSNSKEEQRKYNNIRKFINSQLDKNDYDYICYILYLHTFSINSLIRFNKDGKFNAPYGFTSGMKHEFLDYRISNCKLEINISNCDFSTFLKRDFEQDDFVYCDPPYTNTTAVYNENRLTSWNKTDDMRLFSDLDELNNKGVKFALSNTFFGKNGNKNEHLIEWVLKNNYEINYINHNYAVFGKENKNNMEVLITNYKVNNKQLMLFELLGVD